MSEILGNLEEGEETNKPEPVKLPWKRLCDEMPKIGEEIVIFKTDHTQVVGTLEEEFSTWEEPYYHAVYLISNDDQEIDFDSVLYWKPTDQPEVERK